MTMVDPLYLDEADKKLAIDDFKNLQISEGWKRVIAVLDLNISYLLDRIVAGEYSDSEELNVMRAKIVSYRELKTTPEAQLSKIAPTPDIVKDFDPYGSVDEPEESEKKQVILLLNRWRNHYDRYEYISLSVQIS